MGFNGQKPTEVSGGSTDIKNSLSSNSGLLDGPSIQTLDKHARERVLANRVRLAEFKSDKLRRLISPLQQKNKSVENNAEDSKLNTFKLTPEQQQQYAKLFDNTVDIEERKKIRVQFLSYAERRGWGEEFKVYERQGKDENGVALNISDYYFAKEICSVNDARDGIISKRVNLFLNAQDTDDLKKKDNDSLIRGSVLSFVTNYEERFTSFYGLKLDELDKDRAADLLKLKNDFAEVFKANGYDDQAQIDQLFDQILDDVLAAYEVTLKLQEEKSKKEEQQIQQVVPSGVGLGSIVDSSTKSSSPSTFTDVLNTGVTFTSVAGKGEDVYEIHYENVKGEEGYHPLVQLNWEPGAPRDLAHAKFVIQQQYADNGSSVAEEMLDGKPAMALDRANLPTALNFLILDDYLNRKRKENPMITPSIRDNPNDIIKDADLRFIASKLLPHFNDRKLDNNDLLIYRNFLKIVLQDKEQGSLIIKVIMIRNTLANQPFADHMRILLGNSIRSEDRPKTIRELIERSRNLNTINGVPIDYSPADNIGFNRKP